MLGNSSSQSLHEMMRDTLLRNVSRDNLMMHDSLSRNVSNVSLTELVRNYSSGSLEAVMEQGEAWPDHSDHTTYPSGATYPSHATYPSSEQPHSYSWQALATVSPKVRQSTVPACSVPLLASKRFHVFARPTMWVQMQHGVAGWQSVCTCCQSVAIRCLPKCHRMARMPSDTRLCAAEPLKRARSRERVGIAWDCLGLLGCGASC